MKKNIILFTLLFTMIINVYSQTASDYYLPLCVGNYGAFDTPESGTYGGRKTVYHLKQTDIVAGELAYLQEAYEIGDYTPNDTSIFQQFWLRNDGNGNILLVAINLQGTSSINDAIILEVPHQYLPNEYLTLGYSRYFVFGDETTYDTVVSVSAIVGTYTNCIVVRETTIRDAEINIIDEYYYAPNAGIVKMQRLYHREEPQEYIASLIDILAYDCNVGLQNGEFVDENLITIYPNPASDIVNLKIQNSNNELLKLNIYNALGILVKTLSISKKENQVNVSYLTNGIYFTTVSSDNFTAKQKLVINK